VPLSKQLDLKFFAKSNGSKKIETAQEKSDILKAEKFLKNIREARKIIIEKEQNPVHLRQMEESIMILLNFMIQNCIKS